MAKVKTSPSAERAPSAPAGEQALTEYRERQLVSEVSALQRLRESADRLWRLRGLHEAWTK